MRRRVYLETGMSYHIFSKSIAGYEIFRHEADFKRMIETLCYYQVNNPLMKFSEFCRSEKKKNIDTVNQNQTKKDKIVEIVAFCIMTTHIHLILKQKADRGISTFMANVLNSFSRYYNTRYKRKGPLWEDRFKSVLISSDEQLLHLTRYIHLNPVSSGLVEKPQDWNASSYLEYLLVDQVQGSNKICNFDSVLQIKPTEYKRFVDSRISYQKQLEKIKNLVFES